MQVPEDRAKQTSLKVQRKALLFWLQKRTAARIKRSNIGFQKQTPTGNCQNMLHLVINYIFLSSSIWKWQILLISRSNSQWLIYQTKIQNHFLLKHTHKNWIISPNIWSELDTSLQNTTTWTCFWSRNYTNQTVFGSEWNIRSKVSKDKKNATAS